MIGASNVPEAAGGSSVPSEIGATSILIAAGDPSGDQHSAKVISELKKMRPNLKVWGLGGPDLEAQGAELLFRSEQLAEIGIFNLINKLPLVTHMRTELLSQVDKRRPDCVLLVDFGGFNLNLAAALKQRHPEIPLVYFISPQVWGSRPWRINVIAKCVSKMLLIFPFEVAIYREKGVEAQFVGHPSAEKFVDVDNQGAREQLCQKLQFDPNKPIVGIFPGSRGNEIATLTPMLMQAIATLKKQRPDVQFVMSQANSKIAEQIYEGVDRARALPLLGTQMKLVNREDNLILMAASDILWTKSGTTTLEAAMMGKPMLVFYRGDWVSYCLFLLFKRVKYVAWPNLLAGKLVVPELLQLDCRAEQLVRYTRDWLDVPQARKDIASELSKIRSYFQKGNFAVNTAAELEKTLSAKQTKQIGAQAGAID